MDEPRQAELIAQAQQGDRAAYDLIVGPLIPVAFRLAYGMLHDREAAEDAVQEAAFKAWRKLGNLRPATEMRPWFLAVVANQCRSARRSRWWSVLKLPAPESAAPAFEDRIVRGADLRRALRALNHEQRLAVVLHYYLDLPLEEVAAIQVVPVGTVKSRLHRAVQNLRPQIETKEVFS